MKSYIVYKHTSPSGKVYIGITSGKPEKRWSKGAGYKENPYMARAIEKYGWDNFRHEIIAEGLTKKEAETEEVRLIQEYRSDERDFGYNIDHGGNAVGRASEETREKMSKSRMGHPTSDETRAKISASHKGVPLSQNHIDSIRARGKERRGTHLPEETKRKISEALKGRTRSEEHCRKLSVARTGHVVTDETRAKISETKKNSATTPRGAANHKSKAVLCVETGTVYPSARLACEAIGVKNIIRCCKGGRKTCGGYHWKYYEEEKDNVDS